MSPPPTTYHTLSLPDHTTNISYIEAGNPSHPTLLLLHGFPSSSNQYRNLIPLLSPTHHIIAPDFPGFGLTTYDPSYTFSFAALTTTLISFLLALNLHKKKFAIYLFDYGAPVGLRLALQHPDWITALISQNGNTYVEGLGHPFWDPIEKLWNSNTDTPENQDVIRKNIFTLATTKYQYEAGVPPKDIDLIDPVTYNYDYLKNIAGPTNADHQLALLTDYGNNVKMYPDFQKYLRDSKVPLLAVWGKGDPAFVPAGAEAFKRDRPDVKVVLLDGGHFLLETKVTEVAEEVEGFLKRVGH